MPSEKAQRFTKKPVTVEAIQYTGVNLREVLDFTGKHPRWEEWFKSFEDYEAHVHVDRGAFKILTLEGTMEALPGDWIIRGVKGEHYPCKPDIFAATYTRSDLCASGQQVLNRAVGEDRKAGWTLPVGDLVRNALDFANRAAGEGIVIDGLSPEDFLMDYSVATDDEDWDTLPDRILAALTPAPTAQEAVPVDLSHGWLIHKAGRGWYRPNAQGYTGCIAEAGRYSHEDALSYSHPNGWDGPRDNITIKHESEVAQPPQPRETVADAAAVILSAIERAQIDMTILRKFMNGEPCAALRALKGGA